MKGKHELIHKSTGKKKHHEAEQNKIDRRFVMHMKEKEEHKKKQKRRHICA